MQFSKNIATLTITGVSLSGAVAGPNICTERQAVCRAGNHLQFSFCVSLCHAFIQNDTKMN